MTSKTGSDAHEQDKELRKLQYEHNFQMQTASKELESLGRLQMQLAILQSKQLQNTRCADDHVALKNVVN